MSGHRLKNSVFIDLYTSEHFFVQIDAMLTASS